MQHLQIFFLSCLWTSTSTFPPDHPEEPVTTIGTDRVLVFTSLIEPPFIQRTYDNSSSEGKLEGFIVDLVDKLAERMRMPYRLQVNTLVANGGYGVKSSDGSWNGMVGELVNGEADVAAGALTINPWRQEIIEFTRPYMEVGIATVVKRPSEGQEPPAVSPWELASRDDMEYGMIPGTLTQHFFQTSNDSVIRKMWDRMYSARPSVFEWTSRKGIERVRESSGNYAFFVESAFAEYLVSQTPCDLMLLDQFLNPKEYAFAVPKGSKLLKKLNRALRYLLFQGHVDDIFHKWWHGDCDVNYPASFDEWSRERKRGQARDRQQDMTDYENHNSNEYDSGDSENHDNSYQNDKGARSTPPPVKGWTRNAPRRLSMATSVHTNSFLLVNSIISVLLLHHANS